MNEAAYKALHESAAWIDLSDRGRIRAYGDDRVRLLHAMTTNHVQQLSPGKGLYAFFLNAQGRILADVNLFCLPDHILLDTEASTRHAVYEHLDKFIIADDVTVEDATGTTATIGVEGPAAPELLAQVKLPVPAEAYDIESSGDTLVARATYTGGPGFRLFFPIGRRQELVAQLANAGAVAAGLETLDVVRIENGTPRYGIDFSSSNIPQETGLMHALHFSKGCYLGQEIVERVRSRGHINRRIVRVRIGGDAFAGEKVLSEGAERGEITSAAFSPRCGETAGLAVLRREALLSGAALQTGSGKHVTAIASQEPPGKC